MNSRRLIASEASGHRTAVTYPLEGLAGGANVRFGSKADMCSAQAHVRFGPKADIRLSINYLISELLEQQGNVDAERLRRFLIDKELKFGRLLDGQICWFRSLENFVHEARAATV
jgi:hypothetical protein